MNAIIVAAKVKLQEAELQQYRRILDHPVRVGVCHVHRVAASFTLLQCVLAHCSQDMAVGCPILVWDYMEDGLFTNEAYSWGTAILTLIFQRLQESPFFSPIVPKQDRFRFHEVDRLKVLRRKIGALYPIRKLDPVHHKLGDIFTLKEGDTVSLASLHWGWFLGRLLCSMG